MRGALVDRRVLARGRISHSLLFCALAAYISCCRAMLSLVGGYVHWQLSPDFATSGNMTFHIYSAFDALEGLQASTGFVTNVGSVVGVQTTGSFLRKDLLADKLGAIRFLPSGGVALPLANKVASGDVVNDFVVSSVVGDIVTGRTSVPYVMPKDISNVTVFLVTRDGLRLTKGNGILLSCNLLGISATPCSLFSPPNSLMDLETVFVRPAGAAFLPLHSPRPHTPLHTFFSENSRSFRIVVVDYSGRNVSVFPLGSSESVSSHPDILCRNSTGAERPFTRDGCGDKSAFSQASAYSGLSLLLRTDNKIIVRPKPKFYFSFAMVVAAESSLPNSSFGYTTFQFCAEFVFDVVSSLMPPDWAVISNGSITRAEPARQLRCLYLNSCFLDVCAAHFALDSQQQLQVSGRATFIDVISSSTDERFAEFQLQPQPAPFGVICGRVLFGPNQGAFLRTDTSKVFTVCLRARSVNVVTPSNPLCVSAKVISRPPQFAGSLALLPPPLVGIPPSSTPKVLVLNPGDVIPDQVVCLDTPVNIVFSGIDVDDTEGTDVFLFDNTVGASSVFSSPLNALLSTFYDAASRVARTMISLLVGKSNGFTRDDFGLPLSPRSRRLCVYMVDNSFAVYGRRGDWPHMGYSSEVSCFLLTFASPPEFLGSFVGQLQDVEWPPLDMSPYPFNLVFRNESIDPVLSVGLGRSVIISFLAADSNPADTISFLIREDPGLPSANASVLPVHCIPRKVFDVEIPGGFSMAACSLAAVSVSWTILLERLPASASNGQFSVPLCFIARDSSTSCAGTSPAASATGWYSAPGCVQLRIIVPTLSWSARSMKAQPPYPVISVGVDCSYHFSAELISIASVPTDLPISVSLVGNATELLDGKMRVVEKRVQQQQRWDVGAVFRFSAVHQGRTLTVCFNASFVGLPNTLQRVCSIVVVQVCSVCTHPHSSLYSIAVQYYSSSDWLPLLSLNRVCSPGRLCISNSTTLPVSSDLATSTDSGGVVLPGLAIGSVVAAQSGDTAARLAAAWNTSESLVTRLNPSRAAGIEGDWCIAKDVREDN